MILKKKVFGSAMLAAAIMSAGTCTAMAAPQQENTAIEAESENSTQTAAGLALKITEGFQNADEQASIEKKEVEVVKASEEEPQDEWQNRLMANVEESLNVRTEANEESALAGKLRKGDVAEVTERGEEWSKITSGNVSGYVKNEFCVFGNDAHNYANENCTTNAKVLEGGLRLRAEASEEAQICDVAAQDDVLTVKKDVEAPEGLTVIKVENTRYALALTSAAYFGSQYVEVSLATGTGITVEEEQAIIAKQKAEEEAKRAQEAAAQAQAAVQNAPAAASYDETTILAATIQLEAGNEPYEGQVAVGAVIMNRVRSGGYPNSISGVVYQAGQFSVSGRIAATAASGVKSSCMQAAQAAIGGMDNTGGALSFAPVSSGRGGLVIGNHSFY